MRSEYASTTIAWLESAVDNVVNEVHAESFWLQIHHPETKATDLKRIFRELFLRIYWYQRHTTEAGFHMLGRLPKSEHKLIRALVNHKAEEAEHGEWALRDYCLLGGHRDAAMASPSPPAFAVAAIWWRIAMCEDPFGYLGAEYLFEYLTAKLTAQIAPVLTRNQMSPEGLGFLIDHVSEDVKHTNLLRYLVGDTVTRRPETAAAMRRCFAYFHYVYPIALWREATAAANSQQVCASA